MKKIKFLAMLAFVAAGLLTTTSCSDDDNNDPQGGDVVNVYDYVLVVKSNVAATVTFNGKTQTGTEVTFATSENVNSYSGSLSVTANGYLPYTADVDFSENNTVKIVNVTMVKESTNTVAQASAKGNTVANDAANQAAMGTVAQIEVPSDVNISGNTTDPFSVTVVTPEADVVGADELEKGEEVSAAVMELLCKPNGAQFDKDLTLSIALADGNGCEFSSDQAEQVYWQNGRLYAKAKHFSTIEAEMVAEVVDVKESTVVREISQQAKAGENTFTYDHQTGFTSNVVANGAKYLFLKNKFGAPGSIKREATYSIDKNGYVVIRLVQKVYDYTFKSGTATFTARAYGDIDAAIVRTSTEPITPIHSGGSN